MDSTVITIISALQFQIKILSNLCWKPQTSTLSVKYPTASFSSIKEEAQQREGCDRRQRQEPLRRKIQQLGNDTKQMWHVDNWWQSCVLSIKWLSGKKTTEVSNAGHHTLSFKKASLWARVNRTHKWPMQHTLLGMSLNAPHDFSSSSNVQWHHWKFTTKQNIKRREVLSSECH